MLASYLLSRTLVPGVTFYFQPAGIVSQVLNFGLPAPLDVQVVGKAKATSIIIRGQAQSMNSAFTTLGMGIIFAVLLVYFQLVVNFQSWIDPLIIISALPGAFAGILWMLFATHTTFNVPSLMGAIMCIGVATSKSILLITFANDQRLKEGKEMPSDRQLRRYSLSDPKKRRQNLNLASQGRPKL